MCIFVMNIADQVRLRQVELVIAAVDENTFGVEQRPHGAITQDGGLLDAGKQIVSHYLENTRGGELLHYRLMVGPRSACKAHNLLTGGEIYFGQLCWLLRVQSKQ